MFWSYLLLADLSHHRLRDKRKDPPYHYCVHIRHFLGFDRYLPTHREGYQQMYNLEKEQKIIKKISFEKLFKPTSPFFKLYLNIDREKQPSEEIVKIINTVISHPGLWENFSIENRVKDNYLPLQVEKRGFIKSVYRSHSDTTYSLVISGKHSAKWSKPQKPTTNHKTSFELHHLLNLEVFENDKQLYHRPFVIELHINRLLLQKTVDKFSYDDLTFYSLNYLNSTLMEEIFIKPYNFFNLIVKRLITSTSKELAVFKTRKLAMPVDKFFNNLSKKQDLLNVYRYNISDKIRVAPINEFLITKLNRV